MGEPGITPWPGWESFLGGLWGAKCRMGVAYRVPPDVREAKLPLPREHPRSGLFPMDLGLWAALIPLVCCRCGKGAGV